MSCLSIDLPASTAASLSQDFLSMISNVITAKAEFFVLREDALQRLRDVQLERLSWRDILDDQSDPLLDQR